MYCGSAVGVHSALYNLAWRGSRFLFAASATTALMYPTNAGSRRCGVFSYLCQTMGVTNHWCEGGKTASGVLLWIKFKTSHRSDRPRNEQISSFASDIRIGIFKTLLGQGPRLCGLTELL